MRGAGSFTRSRSVVAIGSKGPESTHYGTGPAGTHSDCRAGAHAPFAAGRCRAPDPAMSRAFQRFCGRVMASGGVDDAERKVNPAHRWRLPILPHLSPEGRGRASAASEGEGVRKLQKNLQLPNPLTPTLSPPGRGRGTRGPRTGFPLARQ